MPKKQTEKESPSAFALSNHLPTEGQGRDEMTQIYAWSFDDALKMQEKWETRYAPNIQARGPFFRWMGAQELKELHDIYKAGNDGAIIEALFVCSLNSLPIPRWCEMAYLKAYRKVRQFRAGSWDDVFGRPNKEGSHLAAKKDEREKGFKVYLRVREIKRKRNPPPIDENFFAEIGKEFGISGSLANKYYYSWRKRINSLK